MPLKNNLLRFLSPTGNMFGPTINLLNIEPTPIDIHADYIAHLESHRRLSGLAFLRVERIAYCRCSESDKRQEENLAVPGSVCRDCPHGPETLYVEVSDPNNFNYKSVLCMEHKGGDTARVKRRRSSFTARTLSLDPLRGSASNDSIHQATTGSAEIIPTGERPPEETDMTTSTLPCILSRCLASPEEQRKHIPRVHFGIMNKPNPNDIIYTAAWPTFPRSKTTHTQDISTLQPKNLPFFQFLAMAKAVSASGVHLLHAFALVQVETECTVGEQNKGKAQNLTSFASERAMAMAMTEEQIHVARAEYRDRYNEFKIVVNFLVERVGKNGHPTGCKRITREEKQKRLEQALQEVETNFNLNLPL